MGSSSGIFRRFFPTAKSEFLCLDAGNELIASFVKSTAENLKEKTILKMAYMFFWRGKYSDKQMNGYKAHPCEKNKSKN